MPCGGAKDLQTLLGEHQDAVVAANLFSTMSASDRETARADSPTAF
jgi:hypothetical protein